MKQLLFAFLFLACSSFAKPSAYTPWYTGPIFTSRATCQLPNTYNLQPYFYLKDTNGHFDNEWKRSFRKSITNISGELIFSAGISKYMDIVIDLTEGYNKKEDFSATHMGDTTLTLGVQLARAKANTSQINIRFIVKETFPTGKYKNLDPTKQGIDSTGSGAYKTTLGLNFSQMIYWFYYHPMRYRLQLNYTFAADAYVSGFNTYGGGYGTEGKVKCGSTFLTSFSLEYSLSQRWVLATDIRYSESAASNFAGTPGHTATGGIAQNGSSSSALFSMAPAIEYNFSKDFGVLGGVWFPLMGRNSSAFFAGTVSFTWTF